MPSGTASCHIKKLGCDVNSLRLNIQYRVRSSILICASSVSFSLFYRSCTRALLDDNSLWPPERDPHWEQWDHGFGVELKINFIKFMLSILFLCSVTPENFRRHKSVAVFKFVLRKCTWQYSVKIKVQCCPFKNCTCTGTVPGAGADTPLLPKASDTALLRAVPGSVLYLEQVQMQMCRSSQKVPTLSV